ncbi:hypothetical protein [Blastococcus sp. PRF04-17]|uniref:hypothetical protein n=1 Tax=Blastococcus sp. PRF04-17 TaxID=2933797 RepID=UPI001FF4ED7A|nr:hypothetical protein [Blastococcus sp. PRF04-17]UOY00267.1 hypothetical protein MVA48_14785 [Blastococcus sp. PRF04-17]
MTEAPPRTPVVPLPRAPVRSPGRADPATQQRHRLHFTAAMAAIRVRAALPVGGGGRRQVWQVCSAARLLTSLGIRVSVVQPGLPWPRYRTQRLQVNNQAGLLGDLALLTAVPRSAAGWSEVADRVLPAGSPLRAAGSEDAVTCPVSIAYRTAAGPLDIPPRTLAEVVALNGLVLEVRLLDAVADVGRAA